MPTSAQKSRAVRVPGVPLTVVMWIDHEHAAEVLYLNAELINEREAQEIDAALRSGRCTAWGLIDALTPKRE